MRNDGCMYVRTTLQLAKLFENLYCSYYSLHLITMFLNKPLFDFLSRGEEGWGLWENLKYLHLHYWVSIGTWKKIEKTMRKKTFKKLVFMGIA